MSKAFLVAWNEYLGTVRTKAFWLGLLAIPVLIGLVAVVPRLLSEAKDVRTYAVVDESGFLLREIDALVYERDLSDLIAAAAAWKRAGKGREFERLPEVVRELTLAWMEIDEQERPAFVQALASRTESQVPEGRARSFADPARSNELYEWWRSVPADELEALDLHLSHSRFTRLDNAGGDLSALNRRVDSGELFAYLTIGPDPVGGSQGCKYVSNNLTDRELQEWFAARANTVIRGRRIAAAEVEPGTAAWIGERLEFEERKVDSGGGEAEVEGADKARQWAPVGFTYLLWIAIFTSAQMLLTSTIEEKSARIIEVLLSSVSPLQLMAGKIAGAAAAGLTMVASWVFFMVLAGVLFSAAGGSPAVIETLLELASAPFFLLAFFLYFAMGYLLYATFLVGIGSVCNNLKEAQNLVLPVMIPMMMVFFLLVPVSQDPNGTLARVVSYVPPFTPFVMMNRAAGPPPAWEYLTTTAVLAGGICLALIAAARLFRIGILMTGKPPGIGELARWLRTGPGEVPESKT